MNWPLFFSYLRLAIGVLKFKLALLGVIVVALLGLYLILESPSYKTSWVMLLPGTERASTINLDNIGEARSSGGNAYGSVSISPKNTYKEIALSDAVISSAASEYGVEANAFSKPRIQLIDQTPAMKFTLVGASKDDLILRAKLYNDTFHKVLDELRRNEIERNFDGIELNLEQAKVRLQQARQDIVDYQIKTSFFSDNQFTRWTDDTEQLRVDQTGVEIEIKSLGAKLSAALTQLDISGEQANALLTLQANPLLPATLDALSKKHAELAAAKSIYGSENPNRKVLEKERKNLVSETRLLLQGVPSLERLSDSKLYGLISVSNSELIKTVNSLLVDQQALIAKRDAMKISREQYLERVKNHAQDSATLSDLQRVHQIAEAIFSSALAKLDTSRLDIYATYPLTQLLTLPGATVKRDRLKSKLMILAGIVIYGLLCLAMTLATIRKLILSSSSDAEQELGGDS